MGRGQKKDWKGGKLGHANTDLLARMEISNGSWSPSPALIPGMVINYDPRSRHVFFEICSRIKYGTLRLSGPQQRWIHTLSPQGGLCIRNQVDLPGGLAQNFSQSGTASWCNLGLSRNYWVPQGAGIKSSQIVENLPCARNAEGILNSASPA